MSVTKRELVTTRSPTGYRPQTTSFSLYIRAYWPQAEINDGMWTPPKVAGENLCDLGLMLSVARRSVYRSLRRNKRLRATAQEGFAAVARVRSSLSASVAPQSRIGADVLGFLHIGCYGAQVAPNRGRGAPNKIVKLNGALTDAFDELGFDRFAGRSRGRKPFAAAQAFSGTDAAAANRRPPSRRHLARALQAGRGRRIFSRRDG